MTLSGLISHAGTSRIGRQDLLALPTPDATDTHKPVPHAKVVEAVVETLGFRHLNVVRDEYAISKDAMKMFGVLELEMEEGGVRFSIGLRNSHDKSFSMALTVGYRVMVCDNLAFFGDFSPVMRKHTKRLDIQEVIGGAVDKMQRNFKPLIRQIEVWKGYELSDAAAKLVIYQAFVEEDDLPRHLLRPVHNEYFEPQLEDFRPRNMWSLSNAFTGAFKGLDPIPQFTATATLARFLERF